MTAFAFYRDVNNNGTYESGTDTLLTDVTEPDAYSNITDVGTTVDTGVMATGADGQHPQSCYTVAVRELLWPRGRQLQRGAHRDLGVRQRDHRHRRPTR